MSSPRLGVTDHALEEMLDELLRLPRAFENGQPELLETLVDRAAAPFYETVRVQDEDGSDRETPGPPACTGCRRRRRAAGPDRPPGARCGRPGKRPGAADGRHTCSGTRPRPRPRRRTPECRNAVSVSSARRLRRVTVDEGFIRSSANARRPFRSCAIVAAACTPLPTTSPTTSPSCPSDSRIASNQSPPTLTPADPGTYRAASWTRRREAATPEGRCAEASRRSSARTRRGSRGRALERPGRQDSPEPPILRGQSIRLRPGEGEEPVGSPGRLPVGRRGTTSCSPSSMTSDTPGNASRTWSEARIERGDAPLDSAVSGRHLVEGHLDPRLDALVRVPDPGQELHAPALLEHDPERGRGSVKRGTNLGDGNLATSARVPHSTAPPTNRCRRSERMRRTCSVSNRRLRSSACAHCDTSATSHRRSRSLLPLVPEREMQRTADAGGGPERECDPAAIGSSSSTPRNPAMSLCVSAQTGSPLAIARAKGTSASSGTDRPHHSRSSSSSRCSRRARRRPSPAARVR